MVDLIPLSDRPCVTHDQGLVVLSGGCQWERWERDQIGHGLGMGTRRAGTTHPTPRTAHAAHLCHQPLNQSTNYPALPHQTCPPTTRSTAGLPSSCNASPSARQRSRSLLTRWVRSRARYSRGRVVGRTSGWMGSTSHPTSPLHPLRRQREAESGQRGLRRLHRAQCNMLLRKRRRVAMTNDARRPPAQVKQMRALRSTIPRRCAACGWQRGWRSANKALGPNDARAPLKRTFTHTPHRARDPLCERARVLHASARSAMLPSCALLCTSILPVCLPCHCLPRAPLAQLTALPHSAHALANPRPVRFSWRSPTSSPSGVL